MAVLCLLMSALTLAAGSDYVNTEHTQTNNSLLTSSGEKQLESFAREWGISVREASEYQQLMRGRRGLWSPGLDPLLALGVMSDDASERRRFAERYVRSEYERTERELAFQREVDLAWKRLYPTTRPIAKSMSNRLSRAEPELQRMALFVKSACSRCDRMTRDTLARAHRLGVSLDVYLTDSKGRDNALTEWAERSGVRREWVQAGAITLNHIGDTDPSEAPAVYLKRKGMPWERDL